MIVKCGEIMEFMIVMMVVMAMLVVMAMIMVESGMAMAAMVMVVR